MTVTPADLFGVPADRVTVPVDVAEWVARARAPGRAIRKLLEREAEIRLAIAFRAAGAVAGANSGNVASIGLPAGHTTNDILELWAVQHDNVASTVSGYTLLGSATNGASMTLRVFGKRDGGAESAPTLTHASGGTVHCAIVAYSGVDTGLTIGVGAGAILRDIQFQTGSGTGAITVTCPAITGAVTNDMDQTIGAGDTTDTSGAATGNWTPPSTFTERFDNGRVGATSSNYSGFSEKLSGSGGSVTTAGNGTGFAGTQNWIGCQLALSSATGGATGKGIVAVSKIRRIQHLLNR